MSHWQKQSSIAGHRWGIRNLACVLAYFTSRTTKLYRFLFHHSAHSHLELRGGTRQKDNRTHPCLKPGTLRGAWEGLWVCEHLWPHVSDNNIHTRVHPPPHLPSNTTTTSLRGISDSDYRHVCWTSTCTLLASWQACHHCFQQHNQAFHAR